MQIKGGHYVKSVELSISRKPSLSLSPVFVYQLSGRNGGNNDVECSNNGICRAIQGFVWRRLAYRGTVSVIFAELSGNTCGDYGVAVSLPGNRTVSGTLCYANRLVTGVQIGYGERVEVSVWFYAKGADFRVVGFLWATADGELPKAKKGSRPADVDTLIKIVWAYIRFPLNLICYVFRTRLRSKPSPFNLKTVQSPATSPRPLSTRSRSRRRPVETTKAASSNTLSGN